MKFKIQQDTTGIRQLTVHGLHGKRKFAQQVTEVDDMLPIMAQKEVVIINVRKAVNVIRAKQGRHGVEEIES